MLGARRNTSLDRSLIRPSKAVCRKLFQEEIDHDEIKKTLEKHSMTIDEQNRSRWNFDFSTERPLSGKYVWEPVDSVPKAYELPTLFVNLNVKMLSALTPSGRNTCLEESVHEESRLPEMSSPEAASPPTTTITTSTQSSKSYYPVTSTPTTSRKRKLSETQESQSLITDHFTQTKRSRTESSSASHKH